MDQYNRPRGAHSTRRLPDLRQLQHEVATAQQLLTAGKLTSARQALEGMLSAAPGYTAAWNLLGEVHSAARDDWSALHSFHRAVMLNGRDFSALINLSRCYQSLGAEELAEWTLGAAAGIRPGATEIAIGRGRLAFFRHEYEDAVAAFSGALGANPQSVEIIHTLGECLNHMGRCAEATEYFVAALRQQQQVARDAPFVASILLSVARNLRFASDFDLLGEIRTFERGQARPSGDTQARLLYAKSHAYEHDGRYEQAWLCLSRANQAIWRNGASVEAVAARERNARSLAYARRFPPVRQRPIDPNEPIVLFIAGASRSGKSTLEALLAQGLGNIARGYEAGIVDAALVRTAQENELPNLEQMQDLPPALLRPFATELSALVRARAKNHHFLTITHPGTIDDAGCVVRAIPNAFFAFVRRNLDDNALRCLQTIYEAGNAYSFDVDECRRHLDWYGDMIANWAKKLPGRSVTVDYEAIIADPQSVLRTVAHLIGADVAGEVAPPGDDRNCELPYRDFMNA